MISGRWVDERCGWVFPAPRLPIVVTKLAPDALPEDHIPRPRLVRSLDATRPLTAIVAAPGSGKTRPADRVGRGAGPGLPLAQPRRRRQRPGPLLGARAGVVGDRLARRRLGRRRFRSRRRAGEAVGPLAGGAPGRPGPPAGPTRCAARPAAARRSTRPDGCVSFWPAGRGPRSRCTSTAHATASRRSMARPWPSPERRSPRWPQPRVGRWTTGRSPSSRRAPRGGPSGCGSASSGLLGAQDVDGFLTGFGGTAPHVAEYLRREVLEPQPRSVLRLLEDMAPFDHFDAGLCAAVTGRAGSAALLRELVDAHILLTECSEPGTYRLHRMLRELLQADLRSDHPGRSEDLHDAGGRLARGGRRQPGRRRGVGAGRPEGRGGTGDRRPAPRAVRHRPARRAPSVDGRRRACVGRHTVGAHGPRIEAPARLGAGSRTGSARSGRCAPRAGAGPGLRSAGDVHPRRVRPHAGRGSAGHGAPRRGVAADPGRAPPSTTTLASCPGAWSVTPTCGPRSGWRGSTSTRTLGGRSPGRCARAVGGTR